MWTQLPGEKRIALDDENLQYTGRIDFADPQNPVFLFTASFVRFRMTGHHLRVVLTNTHHLWENRLCCFFLNELSGNGRFLRTRQMNRLTWTDRPSLRRPSTRHRIQTASARPRWKRRRRRPPQSARR